MVFQVADASTPKCDEIDVGEIGPQYQGHGSSRGDSVQGSFAHRDSVERMSQIVHETFDLSSVCRLCLPIQPLAAADYNGKRSFTKRHWDPMKNGLHKGNVVVLGGGLAGL